MKIRVNTLFLLSILIAAAGLSMFFMLFLKGESLLPKEFVFSPKDGKKVETYTEISPDNFKQLFEVKEVLKASVTPSMITVDRMKEVLEKTLVSPLYPGEFLTTHHVADSVLVPQADEIAYPIPDDWWEVIDWTGRIGDIGQVWLTPSESLRKWYEQQKQNSANVKGTVTQDPLFSNKAEINITATAGSSQSYAVVPDKEERPLTKPFFENVRVRYVFDSANKQIRNAEGINDRSEGTGKPQNVKLFLSKKKYADLKQAIEEGYKLILAVDNGVVSK